MSKLHNEVEHITNLKLLFSYHLFDGIF